MEATRTYLLELTPAQELALAIKIAADAHINQKDKGGNPYILHPLKVMHYLKTDDFQLMAIAALHDVLEDSDVTAEDYFNGIAKSYDATRVKLADLRHNSDVRRLKGLSDKDLLRLRKYQDMYMRLTEAKRLHESMNGIML